MMMIKDATLNALLQTIGGESGPDKSDLTIAKFGQNLEIVELRDAPGGGIRARYTSMPVAEFKKLLEQKTEPGRIGNVSLTIEPEADCLRFASFMKAQGDRLGFSLVIFVGQAKPGKLEEALKKRGFMAMH